MLAVLFGVAVFLGQAGLQVTAGLGETFGCATSLTMQLIVIAVTMTASGTRNPRRWIRLSWGLAMAAIAGILIVVGGLSGLRTASILAGLPFAFIMVTMCAAFYMYLSRETREENRREGKRTGVPVRIEIPDRVGEKSADEPVPRAER